MATLKEKVRALGDQVTLLTNSVFHAERVGTYEAYDETLGGIRGVEAALRKVRSHVRARMRVTLAEKQAVCKHEKRSDGATRYDAKTKKSVALYEWCVDCKLRLDSPVSVTEKL